MKYEVKYICGDSIKTQTVYCENWTDSWHGNMQFYNKAKFKTNWFLWFKSEEKIEDEQTVLLINKHNFISFCIK